jgi:hypothetical protein
MELRIGRRSELRNNSWKPYVYIVFTTGLDSKRLKDVILEYYIYIYTGIWMYLIKYVSAKALSTARMIDTVDSHKHADIKSNAQDAFLE